MLIGFFALILNPGFENGQLDRFSSPPGWNFYVIRSFAKGELVSDAHSGKFAFLMRTRESSSPLMYSENGKGFLQSDVFPVEKGKKLNLSVWVKGDGRAMLQIIWWERYDEERATPCQHQQDSSEPIQCKGEWEEIRLEVMPPPEATKAYIRLVGEDGDIIYDDVEVK
ncbi:hypothetical protein H5T87_09365 [bacterium]|nr:hypothetical protein [bacterium]